MTDLLASALKNSLGLQVLHWAVSQSDIWHLAHRCSELAQKINKPIENSAYVLDNLLSMDEDDIDCIGIRDLHLQQMHFDDEEDPNEEEQRYRYNDTGYHRNQQHTNRSFSIRNNLSTDNTTGLVCVRFDSTDYKTTIESELKICRCKNIVNLLGIPFLIMRPDNKTVL